MTKSQLENNEYERILVEQISFLEKKLDESRRPPAGESSPVVFDNLYLGLEGNIGAGKALFLDTILADSTLKEGIDVIRFDHGKDTMIYRLLTEFYPNPSKPGIAFALQSTIMNQVFFDIMGYLRSSEKKKPVCIIERTLESVHEFSKFYLDNGYLTPLAFDALTEQYRKLAPLLADQCPALLDIKTIHWISDPSECASALIEHHRAPEMRARMDYLTRLENHIARYLKEVPIIMTSSKRNLKTFPKVVLSDFLELVYAQIGRKKRLLGNN